MAAPTATKKKPSPKPEKGHGENVLADIPDFTAEGDTIEPVVITKRAEGEPGQGEATPIFELDGVTYSIPKNPSTAMRLNYLNNIRKYGQDVAVGIALVDLLGDEALGALSASDDVTEEQTQKILAIVTKVFLGSMKRTLGN